jgi:hypothetical protein
MAKEPTKTVAMTELGVAGSYDPNGYLKQEEFIPALRGNKAIKKYREMRENDPIIGATLTAMDMLIRAVEWKFEGTDEAIEFIEGVFDDMEGTFEDFLSEVLSFLPYGFSFFEVVYKRRMGRRPNTPTNYSKFDDGLIGVRKIAPRAQWTIERFDVTVNGDILGVFQNASYASGITYIPMSKGLLFRTTSVNNDPSGRSVLRNAYLPYYYSTNLQTIEAIAIEREMNGMPVGKIPAEYLKADADANKKTFVAEFSKILRDVRMNEQSFVLLPSDVYMNENGSLSNTPKVSFELIASKGTRDIDIDKVIRRHQHNIARTVLADFIMLGQSDRGSFALSQSKTDLFLRSIEGFIDNITAVVNKNLIPKIWAINGMDMADVPRMKRGRVSPVNLEELGRFVARLAGANENLFTDEVIISDLLDKADIAKPNEMPELLSRRSGERPSERENNGNIGDPISQEGTED